MNLWQIKHKCWAKFVFFQEILHCVHKFDLEDPEKITNQNQLLGRKKIQQILHCVHKCELEDAQKRVVTMTN